MFSKKRVLITGASGFIGSNLVNRLIDSENDVFVIQRNGSYRNGITSFVGDLKDSKFVDRTIAEVKPNVVFHLAANKERSSDFERVEILINDNFLSTLNLFTSLRNCGSLEHIITLGSIEEYGYCSSIYKEEVKESPNSNYGFSKLLVSRLAEFFYRNHNFPVTVLRPSIVYGPYQADEMFIPSIITALSSGISFPMTLGQQTRDFLFISDLIDLFFVIVRRESCFGKVLNVGSEQSYMLRDVASMIGNIMNSSHLLNIGALNYRENETMNYAVSNDSLYQQVDWRPKVSLDTGLDLTIRYYIDRHGK